MWYAVKKPHKPWRRLKHRLLQPVLVKKVVYDEVSYELFGMLKHISGRELSLLMRRKVKKPYELRRRLKRRNRYDSTCWKCGIWWNHTNFWKVKTLFWRRRLTDDVSCNKKVMRTLTEVKTQSHVISTCPKNVVCDENHVNFWIVKTYIR